MKLDENIVCGHVDSFLVKDLMLVAYPNRLVFGKPIIKVRNLAFLKWTFLEIEPDYYSIWIDGIKQILVLLVAKKSNQKTKLLQENNYIISWSFDNESGTATFYLDHQNEPKFTLTLNLALLSDFLVAFKELFFKPFVLKPWAYRPLKTFIEKMKKEEVDSIDKTNAFHFAEKICVTRNPHILYYVSEILERHKDPLKNAIDLKELIPEKIDPLLLLTQGSPEAAPEIENVSSQSIIN